MPKPTVKSPFLVAAVDGTRRPGQQACQGSWTRAGSYVHKFLIVDDSFVIRRSLRHWIEGNAEWQVCGEAENGQIALDKLDELRPDIVILDFQMPVMNGLEAARRIMTRSPHTAIVMFTLHPSSELMKAALDAGVKDVVSKTDRLAEHLTQAIQHICH